MAPDCKGCTKWRSVLILTAVIVGTVRGYEESYTISQISPKSAIKLADLDLEPSENPTLKNYIVLETSETDQLLSIEPSTSTISLSSDVIESDALENDIEKTHHRIVERSAAPIMPHRQSRSIQFDELASSRNQITEYDSNDVEVLNKQRYYNQIQPTKTLDHINDVLDEEIESSTISFGTRLPGEGKGVPRGRAIPLQGPRSRMNAGPMISATVSPNIESVGRQQNPDIQDIITGIVKLLNGNVNVQANTQLPGRPLRPMSSRINNRGPPRISDVPPLPPDFDSGLQAQHPTKVPPPYPFDRPPLPDQPPAMKPFLNGVNLPEQLVPLPSNTNYRPGNFHSTRPNIPPWQRPRPRPTGNRRPNPNLPMYKPSPPSILQELPTYNDDLYTTKATTDLLESDEIYNGHGINNSTNANNADVTTDSNFPTNESTSINSNEDISNELNDTTNTMQIVNTTTSTLSDENETVSNLDNNVTNDDKTLTTTTSTTTEKNVKTDKPSKSEIFKDKKGYNNKLDKTKQDDRNKINVESTDKDVTKTEKKDEKKNVTSISNDVTPGLNDDAVLETSMVDRNQDVVTQTSSSTPVEGLPSFSATPVLNEENASSHSPESSVVDSSINTLPTTTPHPSFPYLPYKPRPGIVLDDPDFKPHARPPPVEPPAVITAEPPPGAPGGLPEGYGEIFDVTVSAVQGPGGSKGGMATVHIENVNPLTGHLDGDIIVSPSGDHGFVSIEGKRTYLNLFGEDSSSVQPQPSAAIKPTPVQRLPIPTAMTGTGVAIPAPDDLPLNNPPPIRPARPQLATASQRPGSNLGPGSRRPAHGPFNRRPQPTVRIDTCIVGDDSTCDQTQNEKCKTEGGISSCQCRPGYARRNHRDPCRRVVAMSLSLRVDRIYDRKITWDVKLSDRETDAFQQLNFEAVRAIDSAFSMTPYSDEFVSGSVNSVYKGDPAKGAQGVFVNYTVLLEESAETLRGNVRADIQRHLLGVLQRRANNVGESALWVDSPVGSISHLQDLDECSSPDLNDCHHLASCTNVWGGFRCSCPDSTRDNWSGQPGKAGRDCMSCPASQCSNRGVCSYSDNVPRCSCSSGYYGAQCEVDGEVVGVAVGASLAALLIIILTLVCLVMWSRRWSREQKSAAGMGSPVFSYMANTVKSPNMGQPPYQVSLEERLRWAQLAEAMAQANHYASESAPNMTATRPSSAMFGAYPTLPGPVPPVPMPRMGLHVGSGSVHHTGTMNTVASRANTNASQGNPYGGLGGYLPHNGTESSSSDGDSHVQDRVDLLGPGGGNRGFHVPRPKSRTNQSITNQSGIYYDVDYENAPDAIYGTKGIPLSTYTMGRGGPPFYRS